VKHKPIRNILIISLIPIIFFLFGIVAERNLNPSSPVNIAKQKLVILDPTKAIEARVERVSDGDTIVLAGGERVRYMGVDAPELESKVIGLEEKIKVEAFEFNKNMVEGKTVTLEFEPKGETRDYYSRLLAYVWIEGKMVNLELVRNGLAEVEEGYLKRAFKYEEELLTTQKYAQENELGMWEQ